MSTAEDRPVGDPIGYADSWSAAPGESIRFMVSTASESYQASVVRLSGTGSEHHTAIVSPIDGQYPGRVQQTSPGSSVVVDNASAAGSLTALTTYVWVWPTRIEAGAEQALVGTKSWSLFLDPSGRPSLRTLTTAGAVIARARQPLTERAWTLVCASFDAASGEASLYCHEIGLFAPQPQLVVSERRTAQLVPGGSTLWIAARPCQDFDENGGTEAHFDGKLEEPTCYNRVLSLQELAKVTISPVDDPPSLSGLIGAWRFNQRPTGACVTDVGHFATHGRIVNAPTLAMTGHRWRGRMCNPMLAPEDYGAIYFHSDDLEDVGWDSDFTLAVPSDWHSGLYGVELTTAGGGRDLIPFIVSAASHRRSDVAVVLPTLTYLAYANEKLPGENSYSSHRTLPDIPVSPWDNWLTNHPEFGMSLYDSHVDGSGCCFSSRLRPIPAIRPDYVSSQLGFPRHLAADLLLLEWLVGEGISVDLLSDEDVDAGGARLLSRYQVVLTGSHPEYVTERMLDALESYVLGAGRLMYLGGNGFFMVTSLSERRHMIEVRRGQTNQHPWDSGPGEAHHSTTGELGGFWELRGRPPRALLGVGFTAMGLHAQPYERTAASRDARYAWIFQGLSESEVIGGEGRVLGAAAGHEIDSFDPVLGSPSGTVHLARAQGEEKDYELFTPGMISASKLPVGSSPRACADLTYLETHNGGAVFSVGSMAWIGSMLDSPSTSTVTRNVLSAFRAERLPTNG